MFSGKTKRHGSCVAAEVGDIMASPFLEPHVHPQCGPTIFCIDGIACVLRTQSILNDIIRKVPCGCMVHTLGFSGLPDINFVPNIDLDAQMALTPQRYFNWSLWKPVGSNGPRWKSMVQHGFDRRGPAGQTKRLHVAEMAYTWSLKGLPYETWLVFLATTV